jgi:predicted GIY-YIG superfamily endonuclease
VVLKYSESCSSYAEARKREGELKQLTRKEKSDIIKSINNPINKKSMAKGNNSQKKDAKKPKKAKK